MKAIARSLAVIFVALIAVPALAVSYTITAAVHLLATTALIMGGTEHPLTPDVDPDSFVATYYGQAVNNFIVPGSNPEQPITPYAVTYPAEFFPVFGSTTFDDSVEEGVINLGACLGATDDVCHVRSGQPPAPGETHFVVFGYSQSAVVASLVKNQLIDGEIDGTDLDGTEFYLISNPMRPNGGILARGFEGMTIPIFGITFYGPTENSCPTATPCTPANTDTPVYPTVDVAQQYDFLGGDAPARPLNLLAMLNSLAAYAQLHGDVPSHSIGEDGMIDQGQYGDTQYYLITSERLPILLPLQTVGVPSAALALPDAILRVWIEDAYVRDQSPGEHVQFQLIPIGDPIGLIGNTLGAIPVGIDDTFQQATGPGSTLRPLGTADVYRPFGVGGPVYDKTTGDQTTDSNVLPFNGAKSSLAPQQSLQTQTESTQGEPDAKKLGNEETQQTNTPPEGTKPRPLQVLRDSLKFDTPKPPSATRPSGDGPLKKIVGAMTGQRPTAADAGDEPANDAA